MRDVDPQRLAELKQLEEMGDQRGLVAELLGFYIEETPGRIAGMRESALGGQAQAVKDAAHHLRGSASSIGADAVNALCRRIEELALAGDLAEVPSLVDQLEAAFTRSREALGPWL